MFYVVCVIHGIFWLKLSTQPIISLLLFEMPAIFFCAGAAYGLQPRLQDDPQPMSPLPAYGRHLLTKAVRILVPYWAYALSCVALMAATRALPASTAADWLQVAWAWFNPLQAGGRHSMGMLNWHLWFVPAYLLVIALLPMAVRFGRGHRPHVALLALCVAAIEYLLSVFTPQAYYASTLTCYLAFAWFGHHWSRHQSKPELISELRVTAAACLAVLLVLSLGQGWGPTWAMQQHKFPPDHVFFLFGALWLSVLLLAASLTRRNGAVARPVRTLLTPFIRFGYSIYLWQGMGYWLALGVASKLGWNSWLTWFLAVTCSVLLGCLASPFERVRIRRIRRWQAA